MKPILILAAESQMKWNAKLTIAVVLLFLAVACKKEGEPTDKSIYPTDIVYKNLAWTESPADSGFQLQVPRLPEPYLLSRLVSVYLRIEQRHCPFLSNEKHCMDLGEGFRSFLQELAKDGDTSGKIFYTIRNGEVVLYVKRTTASYFRGYDRETVKLRLK